MLEHGGRLRQAVLEYGIAEDDWVDLSTGIAPWAFPLPEITARAWARLPENEDGLEDAARSYYGFAHVLPVPGSQAAIQTLPRLRRSGRVGVLSPCYAEHAEGWRQAGHVVREISEDEVEHFIDSLDVLVVVNPNNPTGRLLSADCLLAWNARLNSRGGWLVVDEAFMDNTPRAGLARYGVQPGLIVLRSFGKFFGLAGVRLGFVLGEPRLLRLLADLIGPWAVSGPTRQLGQACLLDQPSQQAQIARCAAASERLAQCLRRHDLAPQGGCALFQSVAYEGAERLQDFLARRGILVRLFKQDSRLRFGLPAREGDWAQLESALGEYRKEHA
ncbi:threonine-phosphate decarboxylase [Pseudomonas sp. CFBP 8758]|uniref:threonine-phosphate decarboxylase n=1 Tax=Pseudomonas baltica TaxID=2762576 RepID=A0A7X1G4Z8_9PSED|nr:MULTISPECIES: threonine-phosphate decarboxylase CobD [Pseudomonas]MBC2677884.1 threonine-phosphate decarboxylase [Pseudomonas baltica]MBD8593286.1 threonine-phosphate decarboxylase [Pseudomonas sp. CFBP 8758]